MNFAKRYFINTSILFVILHLLFSCTSIKNCNNELDIIRSEAQLKKDVDFVHKKLEKLQFKISSSYLRAAIPLVII